MAKQVEARVEKVKAENRRSEMWMVWFYDSAEGYWNWAGTRTSHALAEDLASSFRESRIVHFVLE